MEVTLNTGLNISRQLLPQIPATMHSAFIDSLRMEGISVVEKSINMYTLKPIQGDFNMEKIHALTKTDSHNPIIISKDNYILDGHHRWAAKKRIAIKQRIKNHETSSPQQIKVIQVDLNILDLIRRGSMFNRNVFNESSSISVVKRTIRKNLRKINI